MMVTSFGCNSNIICSLQIEVLDSETLMPIPGVTVESAWASEPIDGEAGQIISERGQKLGVTDEQERIDIPVELFGQPPFENCDRRLVASAILVRVSDEEGTEVFTISAFENPDDISSERLTFIRLLGGCVTGDSYELRQGAVKCP